MTEPRRLLLLDERRPALETCAFCPKLSRSACPISDAEASESVTPWGKISGTYDVARGAAEPSREHADLAWACSGCFHCRELCELNNPVAETLIAARSEWQKRGLAPAASERVRDGFAARTQRLRAAVELLRPLAEHDPGARTAALVGCDYALRLGNEARDAVRVLAKLFGPLRLLGGCCGLPLEFAGDPESAARARAELLREADGARQVIVVDSGCAHHLRDQLPNQPFAEAVLHRLGEVRLERVPARAPRTLRYHDPCLLGRGLRQFDAPRRLIERANGGQVAEFSYRRERARCSGAGALVPVTRPETARVIADTRVAEHERLGGGTIVTACAGSLRSFRAAGADAVDLASVVRGLVVP